MADHKYIKQILTDQEQLVHQFGYHWIYYLKPHYFLVHLIPITIGLLTWLFMIEPIGIWFTIVVIAFSICIAILVEMVIWKIITTDVRAITNKRVILKQGFFNTRTDEIKLSAIESIPLEQMFWEKILGVGDLKIIGRGGGNEIDFKAVSRPRRIKKMIENIRWSDGNTNAEISG